MLSNTERLFDSPDFDFSVQFVNCLEIFVMGWKNW